MKKWRINFKNLKIKNFCKNVLILALPFIFVFSVHRYRKTLKVDAVNGVSVGFTATPFSDSQLKLLEKAKRKIEESEISLEQARKQLLGYGFFSHLSLQLLSPSDIHLSLVPLIPLVRVTASEGSEADATRDYWISIAGELFRCQKDSFRDQSKFPVAQLILSEKDRDLFDETGLFSKSWMDEKRFRKVSRNAVELSQIIHELRERDFRVSRIEVSTYRGYRVLAKKQSDLNSDSIELTFGYQSLEASFRKLDHLVSLGRNPADGFTKAELDYQGKIFVKKKKVNEP